MKQKKKAKQSAKQKKVDKGQEKSDEKPSLATETSKNLVVDSQQKSYQPCIKQSTVRNPPLQIDNTDDKSRQDVLAESKRVKLAEQLPIQHKLDLTQEIFSQKQSLETDKIKPEIVTPVVDSISQEKITVERNDSKIDEKKVEVEKSKAQLRAERRAKQVLVVQ